MINYSGLGDTSSKFMNFGSSFCWISVPGGILNVYSLGSYNWLDGYSETCVLGGYFSETFVLGCNNWLDRFLEMCPRF